MDFLIVEIIPVFLCLILPDLLSVEFGSSFLGIKDVEIGVIGKPHV